MTERQGRTRCYRYKQNLPQQFRAFYYVCQTGSFTQAAAMMGLEQPTISLQIAALENEFHAKLIERSRGTAGVTLEGQALLKLVAPIVERLEAVKSEFDDQLGRMEEGRVLCAAGEGISTYVLPGIVSNFWRQYPNIEVSLITLSSPGATNLVARGEVELAIPAVVGEPAALVLASLGPCHVYLATPLDHPLAQNTLVDAHDLAQFPLIAPVEDSALWLALRNWLSASGVSCRPSVRVNSPEARIRYVERGMGLTVIQGSCRNSPAAQRVAWIPLARHLPELHYVLVQRRNAYLPVAARRFADFVTEHWPKSGT